MFSAADHFETQTGRNFYQLAGFHYTVPEDGFQYHEGGTHIEWWTLTVPSRVTLSLILILLARFLFLFRGQGAAVATGATLLHILAALAFSLAYAWVAINVLGVFI